MVLKILGVTGINRHFENTREGWIFFFFLLPVMRSPHLLAGIEKQVKDVPFLVLSLPSLFPCAPSLSLFLFLKLTSFVCIFHSGSSSLSFPPIFVSFRLFLLLLHLLQLQLHFHLHLSFPLSFSSLPFPRSPSPPPFSRSRSRPCLRLHSVCSPASSRVRPPEVSGA